MGPRSRGRGGMRGSFRGARGRGRGRGRGGGRGGAARGGGKRMRFDSSRLAQKEESEDEQSQEQESEDETEESSEDASSGDEEQQPATRPYMALLKSFAEASSSAHKAKRRKLEHSASEGQAPNDESAPDPKGDEDEGNLDPDRDVDLVEEPEESPEEAAAGEGPDDDEDEQPDTSDPFEVHFADPDEKDFTAKIKAIQKNEWTIKKAASGGTRIAFTIPATPDSESFSPPPPVSGPSDLKLKHRLLEVMTSKRPKFDEVEQKISPLLFNYFDTLFCERTVANGDSLRRMACLHAVNHVFKTRDRVIKNNAKLAREAAGNGNNNDDGEEPDIRDQGFTRPKVLMLLPTRSACARMVDAIRAVCAPEQQENRKRFEESYVEKADDGTADKFPDKPADFRDLFEGNDDDMFRLGLKFTRKTLKYFAQFYNSDIILASPLGLRMAIGSEESEGGDGKKGGKKKMDYDFLSSIELVVLDQADALLMQNWEHVEYVFEHLNLQPREAHGCDFSRVRTWYLDGQARHFRQTVVLSAFNTPELAGLLRSHGHNWTGKARVQPEEYRGVVGQLGVRARQTFSRFDAPSLDKDPDARFDYFTKAVFPTLIKGSSKSGGASPGTLVFIPSYLDFVRVRNWFATSPAAADVSFGVLADYTETPEASRAQSHFLTGRHRVLLYTERAHHFRRYRLRGVQRVVVYGLPDNPLFYREVAGGFLARSEQDLRLEPGRGVVRVLFSRFDALKLERVVGSRRVGRMLQDRSDTFVFEEEATSI